MHAPNVCPLCGAPSDPRLLVAHIQATVAAYYHIPVRMMTSDHRDWQVSHPRQVAMYFAAELTPKSYPDIGRRFNRDHSTVIFAIGAVQRRMLKDPEVAADIIALRARLMPVDYGDKAQIPQKSIAENGKDNAPKTQVEMAA